MPNYVMLANWTDQGMRDIEDSPKRIDTARKSLEEMGGHFLSVFMTMGQYDSDHHLRCARRCRRRAVLVAAGQAGQCPHDVDEGVSGRGLPADRQHSSLRKQQWLKARAPR